MPGRAPYAGDMRAGRESGTVTVLFTDLVGSTELMAHLGEDAYDEVRRNHFARLREAIDRTGGEEVKTTGDGVMAIFSSAGDALACAVAMQQGVDRQARSGSASLSIRIGLGLGDVTFEKDDVFGTPVVEAARLVAAARGGQIVATAVVRAVAGTRGGLQFSDLGSLQLKGFPDSVAACEVMWEPLAGAAVPLPSWLGIPGRIFVAREREREALQRLWKGASHGERHLALLGGEPGVGKTHLASEFARAVHAEGATVLGGRCDEDLGVSYQPFVEALRHFIDHHTDAELGEQLGRYRGELVRLMPELAERMPGLPQLRSDPETERYRLFDAVAGWLAAASQPEPLLLVLDDLQWAAKPTLLLLRHVIRSTEAMRLLIVGAYRDTELGRGDSLTELLADLRREAGVERLPLSGLDLDGVVAFMEAQLGQSLDDDSRALARAVHAETEGNPFFVREVLRHLTERGAIYQQDGRWMRAASVEELGIPESVKDVVGRRLSRLSQAANQVLGLAAAVGEEFELAVVQAAAGLDDDALLAVFDESVAARLVFEVLGPAPRYRFAHALVRATLYDELSAARRAALHHRVGEAIEVVHAGRLDDYLPALAYHFSRAPASAGEPLKAVEYTARAGQRALAQLAHDEAVTYYRQALELLEVGGVVGQEARRLEFLIALGEAQRRAGDPAHRETLLDAAHLAQERGDADGLSRAALASRRGFIFNAVGSGDVERVAVLDAAIEAMGTADSPSRARLLATLGLELVYGGDRKRRLRLSDEALALARRLGDPSALADVLLNRYYTIGGPDTRDERLANAAELVALAEHLSDPVMTAQALFLHHCAAVEGGDVGEADRALDAFERLAGELGQPTLRWFATFWRAAMALLAGRLEEAERLATTAFELGRASGQPDRMTFFAAQEYWIRFDQGRLAEVEESLTDLIRRLPRFMVPRTRLALLYCELERPAEARVVFDELTGDALTRLPRDWSWLAEASACAAVCAYLGDTRRALVLYHLLAPYAGRFPTPAAVAYPSVSHYLGLLAATLGRLDEAEAHFMSAAATHERIGAPAWLARTRLAWARMLLTGPEPRDTERARHLLEAALATAGSLGLTNVERHARRLLGG
jgi:class 3 adenylate cyclase/tetratricopeptide (TPR) repeat protein